MNPTKPKIQHLIESLTKEVLQEVLRGFKFNQFKAIDNPTERVQYADDNLPILGEGSSRSVYALGSNKVLKIAGVIWPRGEQNLAYVSSQTSQRGRAQN